MGVFDRLLGKRLLRKANQHTLRWNADVEVVGESYRLESFEAIFRRAGKPLGGTVMRQAHLTAEPENPYDRHAVQVSIEGHQVGYIPAELAPQFHSPAYAAQRSGQPIAVLARVWGCNQRGSWRGSVRLSFSGESEPEWAYVARRGDLDPKSRNRLVPGAHILAAEEANRAALVHGHPYDSYRPAIAEAEAAGDTVRALTMLMDCIAAAEREAEIWAIAPKAWPTERAAILNRSIRDYAQEIAVLERYAAHCPPGLGVKSLEKRLERARELHAHERGEIPPQRRVGDMAQSVKSWQALPPIRDRPIVDVVLKAAAELVYENRYADAIREAYRESGNELGTAWECTAILWRHTRDAQGIDALGVYVGHRLVGYVGATYSSLVREASPSVQAGAFGRVRCRVFATDSPKWSARITIGAFESVVAHEADTQQDAEARAAVAEQAELRLRRLAGGGHEAWKQRRRLVRGRDLTEWVEPIKQMKREGRFGDALELLLDCIPAAEQDATDNGATPAPWYTVQAAIILRKLGDIPQEIALLERYQHACPKDQRSVEIAERIVKARAKL